MCSFVSPKKMFRSNNLNKWIRNIISALFPHLEWTKYFGLNFQRKYLELTFKVNLLGWIFKVSFIILKKFCKLQKDLFYYMQIKYVHAKGDLNPPWRETRSINPHQSKNSNSGHVNILHRVYGMYLTLTTNNIIILPTYSIMILPTYSILTVQEHFQKPGSPSSWQKV